MNRLEAFKNYVDNKLATQKAIRDSNDYYSELANLTVEFFEGVIELIDEFEKE